MNTLTACIVLCGRGRWTPHQLLRSVCLIFLWTAASLMNAQAQAPCPLQRFDASAATFSDRTGTSETYAPNLDCYWLVQPANARAIRLRFLRFSTEINNDILTVYGGADTTAPVLARLSGQGLPTSIVHSGSSLLLRFRTNASAEERGWTAEYLATATETPLLLSPLSISFPPTLFGESTQALITVTAADRASNLVLTATPPFRLAEVSSPGAFSDTVRIPSSLLQERNGTVSVRVLFQPTATGRFTGTLSALNGVREAALALVGSSLPAVYWRPANGPFSASVRSLSFAPSNTILAGTLTGVYRTNASGAAWFQASSGLNANSELEIQALASTGKITFAGTVRGMFTSPDDGRTWARVPSPVLTNSTVTSISVRPNTIFACADGQLFRSVSEGQSWERIQAPILEGVRLTTVFAYPNRPMVYVAGNQITSTSAQIFVSQDDGGVWRQEQGLQAGKSTITSFALSPESSTDTTLFVTTAGSGLFRQRNGGAWERLIKTLTENDLVRDTVNQIAVSRAGLFVATNDGVYRSDDGGSTWKRIVRGLSEPIVQSLIANDVELYAGTSAGVYRSTTRGEAWQPVSTGLTGAVVTAIKEIRGFLLAGTLGSGIYRSADNGFTWQLANSGLSARSLFNFVSRSGIVYTTSFDSYDAGSGIVPGVYRSADNGLTWAQVLADSVGLPSSREPFYGLLQTDRALYAGAGNGHVWTSQNGFSWRLSTIPQVTTPVAAIAEGAGESIFAATLGNGVFRSDDNGSTWRKMNLAANVSGAEVAYSMISNAGTIFVGTFDGFYRSRNNGSSWERLAFPALSEKPTSMQVIGGALYVATDGNGVWRTLDNGDSWEELNDGLAGKEAQVYSIFSANGTELYAGLRGGAVITSSLQLSTSAPRAFLEIPETLQAVAGDTVEIPIILRSLSGNLSEPKNISCFLRFNASMLMPITEQERQTSIVVNGERQMPLRFDLVNTVGMPLARVRLRAVLGNSAATPLMLTNIQTIPDDATVISTSGIFTLRGLFTGGGTRLFRSERAPVLLSIAPNPAPDKATVSIQIFNEAPANISLRNVFGQIVRTIAKETLPEGTFEATFSTAEIPSGMYFVIVDTPEQRTVKTISIHR